jgi:crotonobetainyl-CoA:carnitine CoA-transferase CaiB-like acyl-CoA transferase
MAFLDGYRVLDLTDERGLLAGRLLADLGADVVAVEPPGGSAARSCPPFLGGPGGRQSLLWDTYAANKRGVEADLATERGRAFVRRLADAADFLIESARPGVMQQLGLDWPDLKAVNPGLVYVSVTAFGRTGPKAGYADSDLVVWAAGGPLDPHRDPRRGPVRISLPQAFLHAAADAAAGALIAHQARLRTGRGQHVDVSAQASLGIATLGRVLAYAVGDDHPEWDRPATRVDQSGSGTATAPVRKKWACADGLVELHLGVGPATGGFTTALFRWMAESGHPVAEFATVDWRGVPALMDSGTFTESDMDRARAIVAVFLRARTKQEILSAAIDRKLLCVPIYDTADVAGSAQLAARDFWADVGEGPRLRRFPGRLATVSADAIAVRRPAPMRGEHTSEVAAQWLGPQAGPVPGHPSCGPASAARAHLAAAAAARPSAGTLPASAGTELPLHGLKVLDLTWVVAGPAIGRSLADFGATVVRVESSRRIETARHMQPFHDGKPGPENSALYGTCNAGKLGMTIDLQTEAGREIVRDLAGWCDVIAEAFSPGLMERWGLDYGRLSASHPGLIMISTSITGQTGPTARLAGYGNVGAALSGYQDIVGWPDQPPLGPFGPYTDYVGPRLALVTLLAALDYRRRTGQGCYIDISQVEAGVFFQSPEVADYFAQGTVMHRMGNADRAMAPHGVYPCLPGEAGARFVAITCRDDADWQVLAAQAGRPDLAADHALATAAGRLSRAGELDAAIAAWTAAQPAEQVEQRLQAAGVPAHVSSSSRDFCTDPQLAHRGHLVSLPHPRHGSTTVEGPRYLLSETPGRVTRAAPLLGQDNEYVLTKLLGYDTDRVAALDAAGVLA